jgi:tRNA-specific 2-thiouridylase
MNSVDGVKGTKIFVGLSGGVDSGVTAALLQKAGANVTGVFIKGWYPPGMPCTWADDRRDAMRVAARLQIPFHTLDASVEYKKGVIDYLLSEYAAGRTPNPDIMCNREVKFGAFYAFARACGADFIATGHYARSEKGREHRELYKGSDPTKDQSYFLWAVPQEALDHTLFPLGMYQKTEVRALAASFKLPVAQKKDSQGICFLGSISVDEFLRAELHPVPGEAYTKDNVRIGTHDGSVLYTLGERIALKNEAGNVVSGGPWYVKKKDMRTNTLTVSPSPHQQTSDELIHFTEENWFGNLHENVPVLAQFRYHGPLTKGVLSIHTRTFTSDEPRTESSAPGQSIVFYLGDRCIGGGIIASA